MDRNYWKKFKESPKLNDVKLVSRIIRKIQKQDKDVVTGVSGSEGCLSGDTIINYNRASLGRKCSLKKMYDEYHQYPNQKGKRWNLDIPTFVRSFDGKSIRLHKIHDVVYSGEKEVYELTLENNLTIKATSDHKIMTSNGWVELSKLTLNDEIMCDTLRPQRNKQLSYKLKDISIRVNYHPYKNVRNEVEVHRLIYEASINKLNFTDYLDILWNDKEEVKNMIFIDPKKYHIHHKDGNHYNNSIDNLELKTAREHNLYHSNTCESFRNFNQGIPNYSKVKSIEYKGYENTYDIKCEEPYHNFVANGMVVHNSGKSTVIILLMMMLDWKFRLTRNLIFMPTEEQIKSSIFKLPKRTPLSFDEAMKVMYKRDWQKKERKALNVLFSIVRKRNLAFFMAIPNFWDLDSYYLNHRIKIWIYVVDRGRALIFLRDDNPFEEDPWHRKENNKIVKRALRGKIMVSPNVMANALMKSKNFAYEMTFPDLPKKLREAYIRIAEEQFANYDEQQNPSESDKVKMIRLKLEKAIEYLYRQGWTQTKLSKLFDYSVSTIGKVLRGRKATQQYLKLEDTKLDEEVVKMLKETDSESDIQEKEDDSNLLDEIANSDGNENKLDNSDKNIISDVFG